LRRTFCQEFHFVSGKSRHDGSINNRPYFWLKVAVNNSMVTKESERLQNLSSETPDKDCREASKTVGLDELVKVEAQQLGDDAEMAAKREVVCHLNHVVLLVGIL
jgi:hypothetical protein